MSNEAVYSFRLLNQLLCWSLPVVKVSLLAEVEGHNQDRIQQRLATVKAEIAATVIPPGYHAAVAKLRALREAGEVNEISYSIAS